ncbi:MAG TPA: transglycosylase SLT domain-containing protein [Xanthobacteraceae bacterium]
MLAERGEPAPAANPNAEAAIAPGDKAVRPSTAPPDGKVAAPKNTPAAADICHAIEQDAVENGLPVEFFVRVIWQESRFNAQAVSPKGAKGIAQFMPQTADWRRLSDPFDPIEALKSSASYLHNLKKQFGNLGLAAAAYNAGPGRVSAFLAGKRKRPLPSETRNYVAIVTGRTANEWASPSPPKEAMATIPQGVLCTRLANLILAPKEKARRIATYVSRWGVQLIAAWSESKAWAIYRMSQKRYAQASVQPATTPSTRSSLSVERSEPAVAADPSERALAADPSEPAVAADPSEPAVAANPSERAVAANALAANPSEPAVAANASVEPARAPGDEAVAAGSSTGPPAAAEPPDGKAGGSKNAPTSDDICHAIEQDAAENELPVEFFARVIWQESRFNAQAVSPKGAQGIAQFMPQTADWRGLSDPFNPIEALKSSASYLHSLKTQFGNLGLAAAAYNAGPGRVSDFLASKRPLPSETRNYVAIVTGWTADEWASPSPPKQAETTIPQGAPCTQLANLILAPKEQARRIATYVPRWGLQLTAAWSESKAWAIYRMLQKQYASLIGDREPIVLHARLPGMGSVARYIIRIADDNRAHLEDVCNKLLAAGGACVVLRNNQG